MVHYKKLLAAALTIGCTATTIPIHNANAATMKIGYNGKTRYYTGTQLTFDYKTRNFPANMPEYRSAILIWYLIITIL